MNDTRAYYINADGRVYIVCAAYSKSDAHDQMKRHYPERALAITALDIKPVPTARCVLELFNSKG